MAEIRKPQQKRSIEKKAKILEVAFVLFCERGFEKTNTAEIAKHAGVSTGTVYSYFNDKIDIYRLVFEDYLNKEVSKILSVLENETKGQTSVRQFVLAWKDSYFSLFGKPNQALKEINTVMSKVPDLNTYFSEFETEYVKNVHALLKKQYNSKITFEKVWIAFLIINELSKEYSSGRHEKINYQQLEQQAMMAIEGILRG